MFEINFELDKDTREQLDSFPEEMQRAIYEGIRKAMFFVEAQAKENVSVNTGTLRRSIRSGVERLQKSYLGWVGSNLIYARIQELGGTIRPVNKQWLRFPYRGEIAYAKQTQIPENPYLYPALRDNLRKVTEMIKNHIIKDLTE